MKSFNGLALFAGIGGLEKGLSLAIGPRYRCIGMVECDSFAARVLRSRMDDGLLHPAPIWDDVRTFPYEKYRGRVAIMSGGFPCTDISNAGKRAGIDGEHSGLWREYARLIGLVRPRYVFVENVGALLVRGLDRVLADLASMGFDAEWACVRASDAGAPHRRERLFLLAHRPDDGRERSGDARGWRAGSADHCGDVADSGRPGLEERTSERRNVSGGGQTVERDRGESLGDPDGLGRSQAIGREPARLGSFPPGPGDREGWSRVLAVRPDLAPALESPLRGVADGVPDWLEPSLAHRRQRLKALGNAVVPAQAALAFRILWDRIR